MSDKDFYDAQEHQLNKRLLELIRGALAEHWAMSTDPDRESIRLQLGKLGFHVPVLYCERLTKDGDECGSVKYHGGDCLWR